MIQCFQWLGFAHPDPHMNQLKQVINFFNNLADRKEMINKEWTGKIFAGETGELDPKVPSKPYHTSGGAS